MGNLQGYTIQVVDDKTNYISADRRNNALLISSDIKINWTNDGKLRATFQNQGEQQTTFSDFIRDLCGKPHEHDNSDCSITISDISKFHYCTRKDGEYQLFGGGVTFNGTNNDDKLVMYECEDATVDLGEGNDTVKIEGAKKGGFLADFQNTIIKTGAGNDRVTVSGNFNQFKNNKIFLGKGNDIFSAAINPKDDENVTNLSSYEKMEHVYMRNVAGSEVHATDGGKGWFEKDSFESKTYSANLFKIDGFEGKNVTSKQTPARPIITPAERKVPKEEPKKTSDASTKQETTKAKKKLTEEEVKRNLRLGELYYYQTGKPEVLENAYKQVENYYLQ